MDNIFINNLMIDWDKIDEQSYLHHIEVIQELNKFDFHCPITFFIGENGSEKSTLLEAIANNLKPQGLYILDEPEAALSPQRQLTLLIDIYDSIQEESQFLIVTHIHLFC